MQTGKTDDVEREDFDFIRHSKIAFFSSIVGVVALPALFKYAASVAGMYTSVVALPAVFQRAAREC